MNVYLLPEQLVAVTHMWKLDHLLLLRLPLPLPLPLPLLLLLLLLLLGGRLCHKTLPRKRRKFSSRLAKVHPATSDPQPIVSKFE